MIGDKKITCLAYLLEKENGIDFVNRGCNAGIKYICTKHWFNLLMGAADPKWDVYFTNI